MLKETMKRTAVATYRIAGLMLALTVFFALPVLAQNNLDHSPAEHTVSGPLPVSGTFNWTITSPEQRTRGQNPDPDVPAIAADLEVDATSWPVGSDEDQAEALVSLNESAVSFDAYSQTRTVGVTVTAPAGTVAGDYTFELKAKVATTSSPKPGNGDGVFLTVSVATPTMIDTTPPNVSITAPANGDSFKFCAAGNTINVGVTAADPDSVVTALFGSVNSGNLVFTPVSPNLLNTNTVMATASLSAGSVGNYEIKAWATSAGGTSDKEASLVTVTLLYDLGWLPPLSLGKTAKAGSTIPIKFRSTECLGAFVPDQTVNVKVFKGVTATGTPLMNAVYGDSSSSVRISTVDEQYIVNFQTQTVAADYLVQVFFNGALNGSRTFSVR
jgi:hypothetical protein